ncbi:MAG: glycosyl hydrolase, partial [Cytophagaceae bacterium]
SAVILWGANTGNNTIRDLGIFMYTTENLATRQYWFDENNAVFPAAYSKNSTGILWGWGNEYETWFSGDPEHVQGINILPLTGGSLYMGLNPTYVASYYNEMKANNGGPETSAAAWRDIWWNYVALTDPAYSKAQFTANAASYIPFDGETKAHTYHWISNLDSMGTVDATVLSTNTPTYSVFVKNSCKHYVIYNPPFQPAFTAAFSDGKSFSIPAGDTLIVFRVCPTLPVELISFQAKAENNSYTSLSWQTASELNNDYFEVQRSTDPSGKNWETIGRVYGKGNSGTLQSYAFKDPSPSSGTNYYRLNQIDLNGDHSYSNTASASFSLGLTIMNIYPNPAGPDLHVTISSDTRQTIAFTIFDLLGRRIAEGKKEVSAGSSLLDIDLSVFPSGTYLIQLISDTEVLDRKFVRE